MNFDITGIKLDEICIPNPYLTLPGAKNGLPDQCKAIFMIMLIIIFSIKILQNGLKFDEF